MLFLLLDFPKDHAFDRDFLIQLWMAQGFIRSSKDDQELEYIGLQYFNCLWSRSFFQDVKEYQYVVSCKMHDLVHDLALYVAQEDSAVVTLHSSSVNEKGRYAALGNEKLLLEGGISQSKLKTEKLRTILTPQHLIKPTTSAQMHVWCSKFKHLRVLQLCSIFRKKIPESIGDLVHLRYLDLSYNTLLRELPKSICKLHQLQSLLLKYCDDLQELPSNIRYMISLRYFFLTTRQRQLEGIKYLTSLRTLEILKCHNLVTLPKDMQTLTNLRTLIISRCPSLASLPSTMKHLTRLENLVIDDAIKLKLEEFDGGSRTLNHLQFLSLTSC